MGPMYICGWNLLGNLKPLVAAVKVVFGMLGCLPFFFPAKLTLGQLRDPEKAKNPAEKVLRLIQISSNSGFVRKSYGFRQVRRGLIFM